MERAATRLVTSIIHLTYEQRIQMLKLPTLQYRQQRADMICVYSLFNNIYDLDYSLLFTLAGDNPTRGHSKPQLLRDVRAHVFSQRVINDWNRLDPNINCYSTVFKYFKQ